MRGHCVRGLCRCLGGCWSEYQGRSLLSWLIDRVAGQPMRRCGDKSVPCGRCSRDRQRKKRV